MQHSQSYPDVGGNTTSLQYRGILTVCSAVSLGALCEATQVLGYRDAGSKYAISVAVISMSFGAIFFAMTKWTSVASNAPDHITGGKMEFGVIVVLVILWAVALGIINGQVIDGTAGVVANANIYYFSWGTFITSVLLWANCAKTMGGPEGLAVPTDDRYTKWTIFCASSAVVMGTSSAIFHESPYPHQCSVEMDNFCKRTALAIGIGTSSMVFCLAMLILLKRNQQLNEYLQIETLGAFLFCVAYAVSVGFITGAKGPGATIGNLYYFTWIAFITSTMLAAECLGALNFSKTFRARGSHNEGDEEAGE